jgi:hypothetical protein
MSHCLEEKLVPSISWKNQLQELSQAQRLDPPVYTAQKQNGCWVSIVCVNGISYTGTPSIRKIDSEQSAARKLYRVLAGEQDPRSERPSDPRSERPSDPRSERPSDPRSERPSDPRERSQHIPRQSTPDPRPEPQRSTRQSSSLFEREFRYPNNIFDETLLSHLHIIVRGKNVEICNRSDYISHDTNIVIYLVHGRTEITTTVNRNCVRIEVPVCPNRESFQAMILLSACMELGADSCSVVGPASGQVNRVILT